MKKLLAVTAVVLALSACQRPDEQENARNAAASPSHSQADATTRAEPTETETPGKVAVTFEPAEFEECAPVKPIVAKVSWDANAAGARLVDVMMVAPDGSESLFATTGPNGEKETGPWMSPGITFVFRDHDSKAQIGRVVAKGKPCAS
ncbi:MAG TPA: hypothetical protein VIG88_05900 [Lysobacter sp.]